MEEFRPPAAGGPMEEFLGGGSPTPLGALGGPTVAVGGPPFHAASEEAELHDKIFRLSQDNRELQDYAERATKELRRYQAARPTAPQLRPEDDLPLPPWATNMQMMSPLLFAYEERIAELEAVVERSVSLAEQSQALTRENDSLRAELQERTEQLRAAQLMAPLSATAETGGVASQQLEELQELYRLSVEQNEALAQQNQLLKVQLDRMQQTLVTGQHQAREAQARAMQASKTMSIEQERAQALASQRSAAERRLDEVTAELVEEVRMREELQVRTEGLQHDLQLQCQSLDLCKKTFTERCNLSADEEERLKSELARVSKAEKDQRHRINSLERDLAQASEQLFQSRNEAEATKQEAQQMVQLMESMEKSLEDIRRSHDHVSVQLAEQESQVGQLLLEKDRWTTSEQAAKKHLERVQTRLEDELEKLKRDKELELEHLHSSHRRKSTELEDQLKRSELSAAELQSKVEMSAKQRSWEAAALDRQASVHASEKSRLQGDLEEAHQARLRLERQVDDMQQELTRLRADVDASAARFREQNSKANGDLAAQRSKCQELERQLTQAREELQTLEARAATHAVDQTKLLGEVAEARSTSAEMLEVERRRAQLERQRLERQLQNMAAKAHQDEQKAVELMRSQEANRLRWQTELGMEKDALEAQVERLVAENRTMRENGRRALRSLAAQRLSSTRGDVGDDWAADLAQRA